MKAARRRTGPSESRARVVPPEQEPIYERLINELKDCFQKLFLSTKEATFITDSAAARVLDANLQACTLVGYSRRELLSLPATRILACKEDGSAWARKPDRKARYTLEFKHKSGMSIPCEISTGPVQCNQKPCLLVIAHRASERQMAGAIAQAARLARFVNAVAVGAARTPTIEHAIRFCVRQVCDFLALPLAHARIFAERITSLGVPANIWHFGLSVRPESRTTNPTEHWHRSEDWYSRVQNAEHPFACQDLRIDPDFPAKEMAQKFGLTSVLVVPVSLENEILGAIEFFSYKAMTLDKLRMEIIASIGGRIGRIIDHKRAETNIKDLSAKIFHLQDDERRRLAKELHDTTAQNLAAIVLDLGVIVRNGQALGSDARNSLSECLSLARQSLDEVRTFSYLLHPPMLDELGLVSALRVYIEGFAQRSGMRVDFEPSDCVRLPSELEVTLFHVVQEGLTNAHRHSGSSWAKVRMNAEASEVRISVENETTSAVMPKMGVGIRSMQERVEHFGGKVAFRSDPYRTVLEAVLPCSRTAKGANA